MRKRSRGNGPFSAVRPPSPGDGPPGDGLPLDGSPCDGLPRDRSPRDGSPSSLGEQMSDHVGTFSLYGRSTNHVQQRPLLINNPRTSHNSSMSDRVPSNAPICTRSQTDTQTFGMISTRKARAIAKLQKATTVLKRKRGRGCNKPETVPENPADRKQILLTPLGGWSNKKVPRSIGSHVRTGLKGGHPNWTEMPKENKRTIWNMFENTYVWDPVDDGRIRALWEKSVCSSLSEAVFDAREEYLVSKAKPDWCAELHWRELLAYWKSEKFLKRSEAAKANRRKAPRVSHTTGSKTMERAGIEKAAERGIPAIPYIENYADTHMMRNQNDPNAAPNWIDPKFKDAHDRYVEECTKDFGEDRTNWPVDVDAEKWMTAIGSPKKGRVMGLSVHVCPEELGFNTRKQSLFSRVSSSSQESRREVIELRDPSTL